LQSEFLTPDDSDERKSPALIRTSEQQHIDIPLNTMITRERRSCGKASD
jgi:hypothetical protein